MQQGRGVISFHQWKRKSYSLFAIIGKTIRIGVLAIVYVLSLSPLKAQMTTVEMLSKQDYQLDEVEVRAERTPLAISEVARMITIISKSEIEAAGYSSLNELLNQVSTIDMRQRGPGGIQADISINGGTFEQVLILLNGVNISDPQTGHFHMDIPVPLEAIERIEIISGSAARVLGPNAYSGAINIVTRTADHFVLNLNSQIGQYKLRKVGFYLADKWGPVSLGIASQYNSTAGYRENTDSKKGSVFITGTYIKKNQSFSAQAGMNKKAFGANSFYSPLFPDQYEETAALFSSLAWHHRGKIKGKQDFYLRYHEDEFHLFRYDSPAWYSGPNNHLSSVIGSHHNFWIDTRLGRTSFGADLRAEKLWSNVLGDPLEMADYKTHDKETILDFGGYRNHTSIFAEQRFGNKRFQISGGLLTHLISGSLSGLHVYPGLDISYRLLPDLKVFSSINRSLRLPSFTELFYKSPTHQGNAELMPETSWSYQAGVKLAKNGFSLNGSINSRWSENGIDWVRSRSSEVWESRNIMDIFSLSTDIRLVLNENLFRSFTKGLTMQFAYHYTNQIKEELNIDSKYLMDYLKHKINWQGTYVIAKHTLIRLNINWEDRAGEYTDWDAEGTAFQRAYDPYLVVDLNVKWNIKSLTLQLGINNLLDAEYADFGHIWQPGRWVTAGLGVKF